jgi:trk system potassium uptake protein TrkA
LAEKFVEKMMRGLGPTVEHRGEIIVIGLGRFGSALSRALIDMGHEVLGLDLDPENVQEHTDALTHVAEVDTTNVRALRQLGVADATTVIVCIGADIEASVLTTAAVSDFDVPNIWAKAMTEPHGRILSRVGAHNVVFPEAEMGARVAHLVTGQLLEYLALDDDFVLIEMVAPASIVGVPLGESNLRRDHRVTIVCHKPAGSGFTHADRETVLAPSDLIVMAGTRHHIEAFGDEVG